MEYLLQLVVEMAGGGTEILARRSPELYLLGIGDFSTLLGL